MNYHVLTRLQQNGFHSKAIFVKQAGAIGETLPAQGVEVKTIGVPSRSQFPTILACVLKELKKDRPHIVFTGEDRLCMAIAAIARRLKLTQRYVICFHNTRLPKDVGKLVHPFAVRTADAYMTLSERNKRFWQQYYLLPEDKIWVIPNGIPLDTALALSDEEKAQQRLERGLPQSRFIVGLVTFFKDFKNLPGFVRVARQVMDAGVDAHFVLAGDGPERSQVEQAIEEMGLQARFHLPGLVKQATEWYPLFDLALMTSSSSEAFPLTLIEAMACGLPVVATDVAGIPDIVVHGETGFLAAPSELDKLAQYVVQLARDAELRQRMGEAGRRRALAEFDVQVMVERYAQMFREVVQRV